MKDKINGRTPEEIKKGLEVCVGENIVCDEECPYCSIVRYPRCRNAVERDALAYIQQLERERDQYKRERDAAVEDIHEATITGSLCYTCTHNRKGHCIAFDHGIFEATVMCGQYEWRGIQEVE